MFLHTNYMKINKEKASYIFIISILIVMLAVSVYLGLSGWYFISEQNYVSDFMVGGSVEVDVKANQASCYSLNLAGDYLPGESLPQTITVKNVTQSDDLCVRAKVYLLGENDTSHSIQLQQTANWLYNEDDGYYYYNDVLAHQNKAVLSSSLVLPNEARLFSNKKYMLCMVFETLNDNQIAVKLWGKNFIND